MWTSGESGDLASWIQRVHGLKANSHSGMAKINLQISQLEHEVRVAKSKAKTTMEQADGVS